MNYRYPNIQTNVYQKVDNVVGKELDGIVEDDILFKTKLSKTICLLLQGNKLHT